MPLFSLQIPYICGNFSDCSFKSFFEHNSDAGVSDPDRSGSRHARRWVVLCLIQRFEGLIRRMPLALL